MQKSYILYIYIHTIVIMFPGYNETICFMSSDSYSVLKKDILIHFCILYLVRGWSNNFKMLVIFWRMISIFLKEENVNGHFWHICLSHIYDTCHKWKRNKVQRFIMWSWPWLTKNFLCRTYLSLNQRGLPVSVTPVLWLKVCTTTCGNFYSTKPRGNILIWK